VDRDGSQGDPQAVSEEKKTLQKLYQTLNKLKKKP
jgi:hypothetical protein